MRSASVEAIEVAGSGDNARFTLATPLANGALPLLINAAGNGADISHHGRRRGVSDGLAPATWCWTRSRGALMPLYPVPHAGVHGRYRHGHRTWQHRDYRDGRRASQASDTQTYASDVNALLTERASWCPI